jgi:hypothetical protein
VNLFLLCSSRFWKLPPKPPTHPHNPPVLIIKRDSKLTAPTTWEVVFPYFSEEGGEVTRWSPFHIWLMFKFWKERLREDLPRRFADFDVRMLRSMSKTFNEDSSPFLEMRT